jgi:ankyrin repeat protein
LVYRNYCSKKCQVSDWPRHKALQNSLEKSRDSALGSLVFLTDDGSYVCSVGAEERDANGMTALLRAASDRNWKEVKKLILDGADPSVAEYQGLTALHYASFYGCKALARTLIENGPAGFPRVT